MIPERRDPAEDQFWYRLHPREDNLSPCPAQVMDSPGPLGDRELWATHQPVVRMDIHAAVLLAHHEDFTQRLRGSAYALSSPAVMRLLEDSAPVVVDSQAFGPVRKLDALTLRMARQHEQLFGQRRRVSDRGLLDRVATAVVNVAITGLTLAGLVLIYKWLVSL